MKEKVLEQLTATKGDVGQIVGILKGLSSNELEEIAEHYQHELNGSPIPEGKYMTISEVGRYLNISRTSVWRYSKIGILRPRKIGSRVLFARADIDDYLNREGGYDEKH